jgi:hypothetical protein
MEQQPFYIKFPNGDKLTFANICDKLSLSNGVIVHPKSINPNLVDSVNCTVSNRVIIEIHFIQQKDGMHVICSTMDSRYHDSAGNPDFRIHIVLKDAQKLFNQKITAAIATIISFNLMHSIIPEFDKQQAKSWLKSTYKKFYAHSMKFQGTTYSGCGPVFVDLNAQCKDQLKKAAGLTIEGATNRIKNEFNFLINHLSEDQMIQLWRETITAQVHSS